MKNIIAKYVYGVVCIFSCITCLLQADNIKIVALVPSYNNSEWVLANLLSIVEQDYDDWRCIYINDCSKDDTGEKVDSFVEEHDVQDRFIVIHNKTNHGALENIYDAVHSCADDEVIVLIDGDDFLKGTEVFSLLNEKYQQGNVWMTWGSYVQYPGGKRGGARPLPPRVVREGRFRQYHWVTTHLRTFYAGLFKKIKKEDLLYDGSFYPVTWDLAFMYPMLEMARERSLFIPNIVYYYNVANPLNDSKQRKALQIELYDFIRTLTPYDRIERL